MLNAKQTKKLIKSINKIINPNTDFSVNAFYTILDTYQRNIEYSIYRLSPSYLGVSAYIYSFNTKNDVKIECEIRDNQEPDISENYKFKYCSLSVKKDSTNIRFEENTKLAQNIFLRMHKLYNNKHR